VSTIPPLELSVRWGDMDAFAHVNNTVYFRWAESARIAFFARVNFTGSPQSPGPGPILAQISCRFLAPVTYPDTVTIQSQLLRLGESDLELRHEVYTTAQERPVARIDERIVAFDYLAQHKTLLGEALDNALRAYLTEGDC